MRASRGMGAIKPKKVKAPKRVKGPMDKLDKASKGSSRLGK